MIIYLDGKEWTVHDRNERLGTVTVVRKEGDGRHIFRVIKAEEAEKRAVPNE